LRSYLFENYEATRRFLTEKLPGCPIATLEATYLPWVDVRRFGIPTEQLEEQLKEKAKVWVNCGEMYGAEGYIRLNIACPRERLMEGLRRIVEFLNGKDGRD
jgi:cystathionine beta-lyase